MSIVVNEEQVSMAVDIIFDKYDADRNGLLDCDEVCRLIRDAKVLQGSKKSPTNQEVDNFMGKFRTK